MAMVPELLAAPEVSDIRVTFIDEDGTVRQNGPDGKLIQVLGPVTAKEMKQDEVRR